MLKISSRCHHARMYDCKARFQTKGGKIQKPFLLHTHPLDMKPIPDNNTLPRSSQSSNLPPNPRSSLPSSHQRNSLPNLLTRNSSLLNPMSVIPPNMQPNADRRPNMDQSPVNMDRPPTNMTINVKPMDVLKLTMNDTI
jgi:hypothetical protein